MHPFYADAVRVVNRLTLVFALHFLAFECLCSMRSLASFSRSVLYAFFTPLCLSTSWASRQMMKRFCWSDLRRWSRRCVKMLPWAICRNVLEDFCCINFGGFSRGFSWRIFLALFPTKMRRKNPARKSAKKSGGSKIKIREKSVLPKADPKKWTYTSDAATPHQKIRCGNRCAEGPRRGKLPYPKDPAVLKILRRSKFARRSKLTIA